MEMVWLTRLDLGESCSSFSDNVKDLSIAIFGGRFAGGSSGRIGFVGLFFFSIFKPLRIGYFRFSVSCPASVSNNS